MLSERMTKSMDDAEAGLSISWPIDEWATEVAKLERALDKRLRQEYMDEDHRLGGIGITFEQFRESALADLGALGG